jgi:hypothetical protein
MDLQRVQSENMNNEDSQAAEGAETAGPERLLMRHRKQVLLQQKPLLRKPINLKVKRQQRKHESKRLFNFLTILILYKIMTKGREINPGLSV